LNREGEEAAKHGPFVGIKKANPIQRKNAHMALKIMPFMCMVPPLHITYS